MSAMHYSGGLFVGDTTWLPGWPCCCSGRRAFAVQKRGNQTDDVSKVDCKACKRQIQRSERQP